MSDVQIAIIDQENIEVNLAVPGIQGAKGDTGTVAVALDGTAAAPGISFASDTNTGIYRPGADQLAISTGGNERMRLDSSGRLGIGTSTPGQQLTVATNTGNCYIEAKRASQSAGQVALQLTGGTSGTDWILYQPVSSNDLRIFGNSNDRVTVTSAGSVGIGTTTPGTRLCTYDISGGNTTQFRVGFSDSYAWDISRDNAATGDLIFKNSNGGAFSERARIDSSGRLLVGTSSARTNFFSATQSASIQLAGTSFSTASLALVGINNNSFDSGTLVLAHGRGTSVGSNTVVASGDILGYVTFQGNDGTGFVEGAAIKAEVDNTPGTNDMPGRLVFSTTADGAASPTERMRITSAGNLRLGQDFGLLNERLMLSFAAGNTGITTSVASTASQSHMTFYNGAVVGSITTNGSATAFNTSSDYRLKENVVAVSDGITRLQQLKPSRFNFIADPAKTVDGFLAHEVQDVVPEAITGEKDAVDDEGNPVYQGIDQSKLVPLLTAALQEAVAKIESLEARLDAANL